MSKNKKRRVITTSESIQKAFGFLGEEEVVAIKKYANTLPDNPTVINIGAGPGTSGLALLESRGDLKLVTIDIQDESSPHGCLIAERVVVERSGIDTEGRWVQIHSDSKAAFWPTPVDMVFIDGDHTYEGCKGDIDTWLPRLRTDGILLIHDYHFDEVRIAVDELLESGKVEYIETVVNTVVSRKLRD